MLQSERVLDEVKALSRGPQAPLIDPLKMMELVAVEREEQGAREGQGLESWKREALGMAIKTVLTLDPQGPAWGEGVMGIVGLTALVYDLAEEMQGFKNTVERLAKEAERWDEERVGRS